VWGAQREQAVQEPIVVHRHLDHVLTLDGGGLGILFAEKQPDLVARTRIGSEGE
jgi:hypothetical protein